MVILKMAIDYFNNVRPYRAGEARPRLAIENLTREEIRDITKSMTRKKVTHGAMPQKRNHSSGGTFKREVTFLKERWVK